MIVKQIKQLIPKATSPKQAELIISATKLFHRYGFGKVSVEELCRHAKVSKVTFYRYYKGKDELILQILRLLFDDVSARVREVLDSEIDLKLKFDRVAMIKQEFTRVLGDEIVGALFSYHGIQEYFRELSRQSMEDFKTFLYREQASGRINPKLNIEMLLVLMGGINSMIAEHKMEAIGANYAELVAQINEILVYGLFSREEA
jgi:AcrR family transcriptional regulator